MPDWKTIVKAQLRGVTPEVIDELAGHLEDFEACLLAEGLSAVEAAKRTRHELENSPDLAKRIEQARGDQMNHRSKALWLPGLVSFTLSAGSLCVLQTIVLQSNWALTGITTSRTTLWSTRTVLPYLIWMAFQPVCGVLAAWLSKRVGGRRSEFVTAALFPSLIMVLVVCFVVAFAIVVERNPFVMSHPEGIIPAMGVWVVLPGLGLLLGTIPFWRSSAVTQQRLVQ